MSRKGKKRLMKLVKDIPGGVIGAMHRNSNGAATPKDIDFLTRYFRESQGLDGYTGQRKESSSSNNGKASSFTFKTVVYPAVKKDAYVFHCAEAQEITKECPLNPHVPSILMNYPMWRLFLDCCKEYDTEWIALLIGHLGEDSEKEPAYVIEKFYFPPQVATGSHVEVPTGIKPKPGTIGAIHSHVDMGVFWSGTDTAHSNWPVEIVINRKENYEALARYQLKCGEWAKSKAKVYLTGGYLAASVKKIVDTAFVQGEAISKGSKVDKLANVHPEDQAEVAEAIINLPNSSLVPLLPVGEDKYGPTAYERAKESEDKKETCPVAECTRFANHIGWHRRQDETYFLTDRDGKVTDDDRWHSDSRTTLFSSSKANEDKKVVKSVTVPIEDDPTVTDEGMCAACDGSGYGEMGGECLVCGGDGYTETGRAKADEVSGTHD